MSRTNCSAVVLDALSVLDPEATPVRLLVRIAALFGLTENATRVAISRLVGSGKLEAVQLGAQAAYRLSPTTRALNRYVRAAALGARATVAWRGEWLQLLVGSRPPDRSQRAAFATALGVFHLASPSRGVWLRPLNLPIEVDEVADRFRELGVTVALEVLTCRFADRRRERELSRSLWPLQRLAADYRHALKRLEQSEARLETLGVESALGETWRVGGDVIRLLFRDPLLPPELLADDWPGARLRERFGRYSREGFRRWRAYFQASGSASAGELRWVAPSAALHADVPLALAQQR